MGGGGQCETHVCWWGEEMTSVRDLCERLVRAACACGLCVACLEFAHGRGFEGGVGDGLGGIGGRRHRLSCVAHQRRKRSAARGESGRGGGGGGGSAKDGLGAGGEGEGPRPIRAQQQQRESFPHREKSGRRKGNAGNAEDHVYGHTASKCKWSISHSENQCATCNTERRVDKYKIHVF